jgi:hypothetical protein
LLIDLLNFQEFYIRHLYDGAAASDEDRERLRRGLEAAIQRRNTEVHTM